MGKSKSNPKAKWKEESKNIDGLTIKYKVPTGLTEAGYKKVQSKGSKLTKPKKKGGTTKKGSTTKKKGGSTKKK